jgi:hypothetical protein
MCAFNFFRFGSQHLTPSGRNIINISLYEKLLKTKSTINHLDKSIQFNLRKRCYDFSKSDSVITNYDRKYKRKLGNGNSKRNVDQSENSKQQGAEGEDNTFHPVETNAGTGLICEVECENNSESENCTDGGGAKSSYESIKCGAITDEDVIRVRKEEKKQVIETVIYIVTYAGLCG